MKTRFFLLAALAFTMVACSDNDENDQEGSGITSTTQQGKPDNVIDLGLPSGTLWCIANVGASASTDFGDYCLISYDNDEATKKNGSRLFHTDKGAIRRTNGPHHTTPYRN